MTPFLLSEAFVTVEVCQNNVHLNPSIVCGKRKETVVDGVTLSEVVWLGSFVQQNHSTTIILNQRFGNE